MTFSTRFSRHRFAGRGPGVVELVMEWDGPAARPFVERLLRAIEPALDAGDMRLAQLARGAQKSRKAKLDASKVGAAIEANDVDSVWLTGRGNRGYASLVLGRADGADTSHLHVELGTDPYDADRERADGEVLATVMGALLATAPQRGFVQLRADSAAEYALRRTSLGIDAHPALNDVAWRQIVDPAHAPRLAPLLERGLVQRRGEHHVVVLEGTVSDVFREPARRARMAIFAAVHPDVAAPYEKQLAERAAVLEGVDAELDEDAAELLLAAIGTDAPYAQAAALRWTGRALPLDEHAPAASLDAPRSRELPRVLAPLGAEALALLHAERLPTCLPPSLAGLQAVDLLAASFGIDRIGRLFMQAADVERHLVPALGAYLGEAMVRELGGAWVVPRGADLEPDGECADWPVSRLAPSECDRIAVVVGDRAWFPFARARKLVHAATRQGFNPTIEPILEMCLTKMMRAAARLARDGLSERAIPHPSATPSTEHGRPS